MRIYPFRNPGYLLPLAILALCLMGAVSGAGAIFTVTKTADTNGTCNSGADCSLREAINAANDEANNPGADTIVFAAGVSGAINLTTALPAISTEITVQGPGANVLAVTRASGTFRIFEVRLISAQNGSAVTISGLTISNGHCVYDGTFTSDAGGGILNFNGTLTVSNCVISNNTATSSQLQSSGGGIGNFFSGNLTVDSCTFIGNSANSGGAIFNLKSVVLKNSTLRGNTADEGGGRWQSIHWDSEVSEKFQLHPKDFQNRPEQS